MCMKWLRGCFDLMALYLRLDEWIAVYGEIYHPFDQGLVKVKGPKNQHSFRHAYHVLTNFYIFL